MKKILIALIACFTILFAGCSENAGVTLIHNSDGTVTESFYSPFPTEKIYTLLGENVTAQVKIEKALKNIANYCTNDLFLPMMDRFKIAVNNSENYSDEEKEELLNSAKISNNMFNESGVLLLNLEEIIFQIDFESVKVYQLFMSSNGLVEKRSVSTEKKLFVTKTITTKVPLIENKVNSTLFIGQEIMDDIDKECEKSFGTSTWNNLKNELNYDLYSNSLNYTYAVPTGRLHSNANTVTSYQGYYFHTWNISLEDSDAEVQIEYWTITANKWIWYVLTFAGGVCAVLITFIFSKKKHKDYVKLDN